MWRSTAARRLRYSRTSSRLGMATCRNARLARMSAQRSRSISTASSRSTIVVEAVDAEQQGPAGELLTERLDVAVGRSVDGVSAELGRVDRDWRARGRHHPPVRQRDRRPAYLDAMIGQQPTARTDEVGAIPLGVEGHHVGTEQPEQDLLPPRQTGENVRWRPRHMQEEPDGLIWSPLSDQPRDEHEVVVMYPRERASPLGYSGEGNVSESGVDLLVALPPGALESWFFDRVMQQRPQRSVGEAVIIVTDLSGGQADRQ